MEGPTEGAAEALGPDFHMDQMLSAMEMTTAQFSDFMQGRKTLFNTFYLRVVQGLRRNERVLMQGIAKYRDKNINILSNPYLLDYTKFNKEDSVCLFKATGIEEEEMDAAVKELKDFIKQNCKSLGVMPPDFVNTTGFRVLLILVMRFYLERGDDEKLGEVCAFYAYSMFYTIFYNYFRNLKPRPETMVYAINNMSSKFKIRQEGTVDGMLRYSVKLCANTYASRIMDCTDQDVIYVIGQIKSRMRDFIKNIKNAYVEADKNKDAIFSSKPILNGGEDGDEANIIDRRSTSSDVIRTATIYTNKFFKNQPDAEIVKIVSVVNEVSRQEITNSLDLLRRDPQRIPEVQKYLEAVFYLYLGESQSNLTSIHSKNFLTTMDKVYRKGNSKDPNILLIKKYINEWLTLVSPVYRETRNGGTINGLRRAIYQYFAFFIMLRH